ncbi:hypothetical protein HDU90_004859 [Geranomyces variabilis]|nr:hypothetical protein HDU90_004859 [Geranomyces variabilis]
MPRLLPATLDIILIATLLAGLRRSGDFGMIYLEPKKIVGVSSQSLIFVSDFATDNVPSPALRWLLFQFLFVGERFLDVLLVLARKYPAIFRPRNPKLCPPSPPPLPPAPPPPPPITVPPVQNISPQPQQQLQIQRYSQLHPLPSPPPQRRQRVVVAYQDYAAPPPPSSPPLAASYDVREPLPTTTTYTYAIPQPEYAGTGGHHHHRSMVSAAQHGQYVGYHQQQRDSHYPRAQHQLVPVAGGVRAARRVVQQAWNSGVYAGKGDEEIELDEDYRVEYVGRRSAVDR